ncbi:MAG: NAD(+)/NADH kinase [Lachnospiraceae bacterium]|nr:NAD(+)/NADH kinase [Lachnospiraceae bacterium]
MRKIGVLPNTRKDDNFTVTKKLVAFLIEKGCHPLVSESVAKHAGLLEYAAREDAIFRDAEFLITLGGDGTMLSAGKRAAKYNTPLLGINLGHLGFLTDCGRDEMEETVEKVLNGKYKLEKRMMLKAEINSAKDGKKIVVALNEVSISRGSMVDVGVYVNDEFIDDFFGDGILVATPTGSTAYNLAAGGPILKSDANMVAITPICPHMLHARSIVVGADDEVMLKVKRYTRQRLYAVIDGQSACNLEIDDYIVINRAQHYTNIIKTGDLGFYDVLREKMFTKGGKIV